MSRANELAAVGLKISNIANVKTRRCRIGFVREIVTSIPDVRRALDHYESVMVEYIDMRNHIGVVIKHRGVTQAFVFAAKTHSSKIKDSIDDWFSSRS